MAWYKTGTINVTNGNPTVYGNGTLWVDAAILNSGDVIIAPDGKLYEIGSIQSNTQLTLTAGYLGSTAATQPYAILPIGLLPSALAQQVKATLSAANTALSQAVRFDAQQNLTAQQQTTARSNIGALAGADVGLGLLSKSVAGNTNIALSGIEAAGLFYEFTGALTGNISVIVPATVRQFFVRNATTGAYSLTVKTANGTGIAVLQGTRMLLECDGTNVLVPVSLDAAVLADVNGNVGLEQVPFAWAGAVPRALDMQYGVSLAAQANANSAHVCVNCYYDGSAWRYKAGGIAARLVVNPDGISGMTLFTAPSGAPGGAITWTQPFMVSADGNVGIGGQPGANERLYMLTNNGQQCVVRLGQYTQRDWYMGIPAASPNFAIIDASAGQQRLVLDTNGNLLVGASGGSCHTIAKNVGEGSLVFAMQGSSGAFAYFFAAGSGGGNAAASALTLNKNSSTGRSINAAGTVNASGADYAEYMTKASGCRTISPGQIVGVDANGLLVDKWSAAVSFRVKSTNPSYVGGDTWGSDAALQVVRPHEPAFDPPAYAGAVHPGDAPGVDADDDEREAYSAALAAYDADQQDYVKDVTAAREQFDSVTMPAYRADLAHFNEVLEQARQRVDRIAFCGQVPVNVTGATPGQYVVPVQDGDAIGAALVNESDLTFEQYRRAVGRVQNILPDGRANVVVKVV